MALEKEPRWGCFCDRLHRIGHLVSYLLEESTFEIAFFETKFLLSGMVFKDKHP